MTGTAVVFGAQGVVGTFIARGFSEAGWRVFRAGRRPDAAVDFRRVDLDDPESVRAACAGADVVVNTVAHPELTPELTVMRDGGVLINLTDLDGRARARLAAQSDGGARGLVVVDTGFSGIAYLALAGLLAEHPDADGAEYALMFSAAGSSGRAGALFAHGLLTDAPRHDEAVVPFPAPFGRVRGIAVERGLRADIGGRALRHYLCMQPRALRALLLALNRARLTRALPAASFTAATRKLPAQLSEEPICERVAVTRAGRPLAAQTLTGRGYYRMTVAATVAFADALLAGERACPAGVRSIDELLTLDDLRGAVERSGIEVRPA